MNPPNGGHSTEPRDSLGDNISKSESPHRNASSSVYFSPRSSGAQMKVSSDPKIRHAFCSPGMAEPSAALFHHVDQNFHDVFQLKHGGYADLPATKISDMMKSKALDNAPTQSLLSVVNGILDESVEKRNGEIPHRVACLLRKVVQEIERRISTQADHLRTQNNLFKAREEKYQSRIRVLEALASGAREENEVVENQFQQVKTEKTKEEDKKKAYDEDVNKLMKEQDQKNMEISRLIKEQDQKNMEISRLTKEQDQKSMEISRLKQEVETLKNSNESCFSQLEAEAKDAKGELKQKSQEYEQLLRDLRNKVKELEVYSDSKLQKWHMKENQLQNTLDSQFSSLKKLKLSWESIKQDVMKEKGVYSEECNRLGQSLKSLVKAAENHHAVLAENRRLFNEVQELKGNIRVYCRVRPFHPAQKEKKSIVEHVGENDLVVANPAKQGKDALRSFKFNKVFGPATTQVEVYSDIQAFIRSVLDGYNVCIFAYGQTGSGKTYTMSGPNGATKETFGVNYRALNDLFGISESRASSIVYEIGVQMVEIYNEQVRDLLSSDGSQKKLGILTHSQHKGLAVPDASMFPVKSTSDVMDLMDIGLKNRASSATAMNERSSRSHSVVSIHVRGNDVKSGSSMQGNLHLVDLAGSERIDRSEVTGDRLKEAQHINKSLSALGDVIFALAQKNSHIPYRNSKLTQLLQSSLGGQAKTLMFVQLNPDVNSFSETLSTLKFAERVSGVELGAARSSKEGRDVRELMEQVASLKDTISEKDEEIERLQLLKDLKNGGVASLRYGSSFPIKDSVGGGNKHSEADYQQSMDDLKHKNESPEQSKVAGEDIGQNISADAENLGFGDADYGERLSDISDSGLSVGTETDGSSENYILTGGTKSSDHMKKSKAVSEIVRALQNQGQTSSSTTIRESKNSLKSPSIRRSSSGSQLKPQKGDNS